MNPQVKKEIEQCYELINRLGRGVVYLGSSRMGPNHPHYQQAFELSREASFFFFFFSLDDFFSWSLNVQKMLFVVFILV